MRIDVTSSERNTVNEFSHDGGSLDAQALLVVVIPVEECSGSTAERKFFG